MALFLRTLLVTCSLLRLKCTTAIQGRIGGRWAVQVEPGSKLGVLMSLGW